MPFDLILHLVVLVSFSLDISLIMHLTFSSDPAQNLSVEVNFRSSNLAKNLQFCETVKKENLSA